MGYEIYFFRFFLNFLELKRSKTIKFIFKQSNSYSDIQLKFKWTNQHMTPHYRPPARGTGYS
jgi:hypothetical protein